MASNQFYIPARNPTVELLRAREINLLKDAAHWLTAAGDARKAGSVTEAQHERAAHAMVRAAMRYGKEAELLRRHEQWPAEPVRGK